MIDLARIKRLNDDPPHDGGKYLLYWMQQSQRTRHSPALEYAIEKANAAGLPLVVCFGVMDDYPEGTARTYLFLLQGLRDVAAGLEERGVKFDVPLPRSTSAALATHRRLSDGPPPFVGRPTSSPHLLHSPRRPARRVANASGSSLTRPRRPGLLPCCDR